MGENTYAKREFSKYKLLMGFSPNQNEFHNLTIFVQQLKVQRRFSQFSADCAPQKSLKREDNTNERKEEPGKSFRVSRICFKTQISLKDAIS